ARMEREIDAAEAQLVPLREFILPGGSVLAAQLHVARTVCRRAGRGCGGLGGGGGGGGGGGFPERLRGRALWGRAAGPPPRGSEAAGVTSVNRRSDWLFVHARLANHLAGRGDVAWKK